MPQGGLSDTPLRDASQNGSPFGGVHFGGIPRADQGRISGHSVEKRSKKRSRCATKRKNGYFTDLCFDPSDPKSVPFGPLLGPLWVGI